MGNTGEEIETWEMLQKLCLRSLNSQKRLRLTSWFIVNEKHAKYYSKFKEYLWWYVNNNYSFKLLCLLSQHFNLFESWTETQTRPFGKSWSFSLKWFTKSLTIFEAKHLNQYSYEVCHNFITKPSRTLYNLEICIEEDRKKPGKFIEKKVHLHKIPH